MSKIAFVNAGYNVPEFEGLSFNWCLYQHAFIYFQGPAIVNGSKIDSGACILYPKYMVHDYTTLKGFVNSYIGFQAPVELFSKLSIKTGKIIYPSNCNEINEIIREICHEDAERQRGYTEAINALILKMLVAVSRGTEPENEKSKNTDAKCKMEAIRSEYLSDIVNVPDIENIICDSGFSRTQFYRLYSLFFHVSPKADLIWARLERARSMLRANPDSKMYEIAVSCGFSDIPYFFRAFKKRYGYTPKDYANAAKEDSGK